jgi:hypothetical protein
MKIIAALGLLIVVLAIPVASLAAKKEGRTYEECQQLAISRGIPIKRTHAHRYMMLKGMGQKTEPKGFMARCVAGLQD